MDKDCNISAIIQVRMESERLPGKALRDIDGKYAIERVVDSLKPSKYIKSVIVATTTSPQDDPLIKFVKSKGIPFFRGDEKNVVKRFIGAAQRYGVDIIVRASGDCPLLSYELTDHLIENHFTKNADYTAVEFEKVPVGIFADVISYKALHRLADYPIDFNYSEYLALYFKNNPDIFSLNIITPPDLFQHSEYRLTLDYKEDLEMFDKLFVKLRGAGEDMSFLKVLKVLKENPEIANINRHLTLKYKTDNKLIKDIFNATRIGIKA